MGQDQCLASRTLTVTAHGKSRSITTPFLMPTVCVIFTVSLPCVCLSGVAKTKCLFWTGRDLQCDFENEFWEDLECSWTYNQAILASMGAPDDTVRMTRKKVTRPTPTTEARNYWHNRYYRFDNYIMECPADTKCTLLSAVQQER